MKEAEFRKLLALADGWQIWAFTPGTLAALQSGPSPGYHALALKRAADRGILVRAARGIYVNPLARSLPADPRPGLVPFLRPRDFNYLSLEAALSQSGAIAQGATALTCMTTGSSGQFDTPWGRIELVHTDRPVTMESGIVFERGRLAEATPARAWSDLKRVGRNVDLVDPDFMHASATAGAGR